MVMPSFSEQKLYFDSPPPPCLLYSKSRNCTSRFVLCGFCSSFLLNLSCVFVCCLIHCPHPTPQAVESYLHRAEQYQPQYCVGHDQQHNTTCCQLFNATSNFTLSVPLCDCTRLCPDSSLLPVLSEDFCSSF